MGSPVAQRASAKAAKADDDEEQIHAKDSDAQAPSSSEESLRNPPIIAGLKRCTLHSCGCSMTSCPGWVPILPDICLEV